jgi:hypothetical protein
MARMPSLIYRIHLGNLMLIAHRQQSTDKETFTNMRTYLRWQINLARSIDCVEQGYRSSITFHGSDNKKARADDVEKAGTTQDWRSDETELEAQLPRVSWSWQKYVGCASIFSSFRQSTSIYQHRIGLLEQA